MACGGCKKKGRKTTYSFVCLDCNEVFNIDTTGRIILVNGKYYSKGINNVVIKHEKCGSKRCKKN